MSDNPYELDTFQLDSKKIPDLTKKNVNFIEGILKIDSNYKRESEKTAPDEGFNPEVHYSSSKGKYCGAMNYWFEKIKEDKNFEKNILGAVIAVDSSNSTHLQVSKNGRMEMKKRIVEKCKNYKEFSEKLNVPYDPNNKDHLLNYLLEPMDSTKEGQKQINLSFASKFFSYAAMAFNTEVQYSRYDSVVAKNLPDYQKKYLNEPEGKKTYIITDSKNDNRKEIYKKYCDTIQKILNNVNQEWLNKNTFDHLVWYTLKG